MKSLPDQRITAVVKPAIHVGLLYLREVKGSDFGEIINEAVTRMIAEYPGMAETINARLKKKAARMGFKWGDAEIEVPIALVPKPRKALRLPASKDKPMERWRSLRKPLPKPKDK